MTEPSQLSARSDFRLDVDLANQAVAKLRGVSEHLRALRRQASELSRQAQTPTAHDLVSLEASQLLAQKADGAQGSLGFALDEGIEYVEALILQMNADIALVENEDAQAASDLS